MTSVVVLTSGFQFHAEVSIEKFWSWLVREKIHVVASHDGKKTYVDYSREKMSRREDQMRRPGILFF